MEESNQSQDRLRPRRVPQGAISILNGVSLENSNPSQYELTLVRTLGPRSRTGEEVLRASLVRVLALLGASIIVAGGVASASASSGSACVNVGLSKCVKVHKPINMAYFAYGVGDSWGTANAQAIKQAAQKAGVHVTVFDPAFTPDKQFQQIQAALQSKKYNAFGIVGIDPNLVCNAVTKVAPSQGIIVAAANEPLCHDGTGPNTAKYAPPGTLTYIGNTNVSVGLSQWLTDAAKANPGPQTVLVVTGVATDGITTKLNALLTPFKKAHPNWHFVGQAATDYSSAQGYSVTQNLLNAHPTATMLFSTYADITTGAVRAIAQAGKTKIHVIDDNGDQATAKLVCQGKVQLSIPEAPRTEARLTISAIVKAFDGKKVSRFISTLPEQPVLTKKNACSYKAEY